MMNIVILRFLVWELKRASDDWTADPELVIIDALLESILAMTAHLYY
jgi:hypothetical protein